jgi:hypothetical protein
MERSTVAEWFPKADTIPTVETTNYTQVLNDATLSKEYTEFKNFYNLNTFLSTIKPTLIKNSSSLSSLTSSNISMTDTNVTTIGPNGTVIVYENAPVSATMSNYTGFITKMDAEIQKLTNINDSLQEGIQASRKPSGESIERDVAHLRNEQVKHPDQHVSYYEHTLFPLNRPLTATWLYILMFVSTFLVIVSILIFLRIAHIEVDIKFPFTESEGGGGVGQFLDIFSTISPSAYVIIIGGGALVGGGIAYAIAKYA